MTGQVDRERRQAEREDRRVPRVRVQPRPVQERDDRRGVAVAQRAQRPPVRQGQGEALDRGGSVRRCRNPRPGRAGRRTRRWVRSPCHSARTGERRGPIGRLGVMSELARVHLSKSAPEAYKTLAAFSKSGRRNRRRSRASTRGSRSSSRSTCRSSTGARTACACTSSGRPRRGSPSTRSRSCRCGANRVSSPSASGPASSSRSRFTFISEEGVPDDVYDRVGGILSEKEYIGAELDPRLDQRLQPGRDRRPLQRAAARRPGRRGPRRRVGRRLVIRIPLVPGAVNFRDVGGLPAGSSPHALGRAVPVGQPRAARAEGGVAALRRLGIRRIIDLRADEEVRPRSQQARADSTSQTQRVPLFLGSVASFFARRHPAR